MKKSVALLLIVSLFLVGCGQKSPEIVCNAPYIRHGAGCCMDQNDNSICDDEEDILFEPDYAPVDIPFEEPEYEVVYEEPEMEIPEPKILTPEPEEVMPEEPKKSTYKVSEPKLLGWSAENDLMSIKVTKIIIEVVKIEPKDLISPDKEAYLKEMHLEIKNKEYNYIGPKIFFNVGDERDPLIIRETLLCDRSDDLEMDGCDSALPEAETINVRMVVDRKIPRLELDKTFRIVFENKRDIKSANVLEIEETYDILKIPGAKYV